jgi:hypothetical protein
MSDVYTAPMLLEIANIYEKLARRAEAAETEEKGAN